MTRLFAAACLGFCVAAWARPAAAQKLLFVNGLQDLAEAMVATPADAERVRTAIDTMAKGVAGWDRQATSADQALLDDTVTPILPLAAYASGFGLIVRGDYDEAIRSLRLAASTTTDERSRLVTAGLLVEAGRSEEAERVLLNVLEVWPESAVARWWLARIYDGGKRFADARRLYETLVPVAVGGRSQLYSAIGRLAHGQGDFAGALEAFRARARFSPRDPAAHRDLARMFLDYDRAEDALAEYAAALSIDPRDAESHAASGRIHLDAGRPAEAIASLRRSLDLAPDHFDARYPLAIALRQTGRADEAARELQLFERASRKAIEDRRRTIAEDLKK